MWVLEARKDAEKITYPVVWENQKDADNVIDYDIRGEETKDTSAMINANNQTTTGMATVIPWVNAPKLIESTSIISTPVPWYIYAVVNFRWAYINEGTESLIPSLSDQIWEPQFTTQWVNNRFLRIPADWVYKISITYPDLSTARYSISYKFFSSEKWEIDYVSPSNWDVTKDYTLEMKKWELLSWTWTVIKIDSTWWWTVSPYFYWTITRLW
jgi:hypothetical protein